MLSESFLSRLAQVAPKRVATILPSGKASHLMDTLRVRSNREPYRMPEGFTGGKRFRRIPEIPICPNDGYAVYGNLCYDIANPQRSISGGQQQYQGEATSDWYFCPRGTNFYKPYNTNEWCFKVTGLYGQPGYY